MTIFIRWAHVVYKYFSFILGMASSILCGLWVQHGLESRGVCCTISAYGCINTAVYCVRLTMTCTIQGVTEIVDGMVQEVLWVFLAVMAV